MDSASDFGSGGWGFESPLGLLLLAGFFLCFFFVFVFVSCSFCASLSVGFGVCMDYECSQGPSKSRSSKFGRVVKALALGASLERGMGSNPIACSYYFWTEMGV